MNLTRKSRNFFNIFPVPRHMLITNASIVIRDRSVKFFQFRRGFLGRELPPIYDHSQLTPGVVERGEIKDAARLTSVLKEISLRHGIRYALVTLPEEKAYLFTATIPKVPFSGLRDAVAFIIEENVPLALADAVFDFEMIKSADPSMLRVAVSVLPKKAVDSYIAVFENAGLTPISFTVESQAVARAIVPRGNTTTQLVVNLGEEKSGFYVVEDEAVQFTTTLPVSTSAEEAANDLRELKSELKKVLAFWDTKVNNEGSQARKIEKALLCGIRANNEAFVEELFKDITLEHTLADVWVNISTDHMRVRKELYAQSSEYASAIGLSLPQHI